MAETAQPGRGAGYFQRPGPVSIVFGCFFLITVPLAFLHIFPPGFDIEIVFIAQSALIGTTHFIITAVIYLQSDNLRYFASSTKNRLIYFVAPLGIFLLAGVIGGTGITKSYRVVGDIYFTTLRAFDFTHVVRQSFGVLQLFKGAAGRALPAWSRKAENLLFLSMALLQLETWITDGHYDSSNSTVQATTAVVAGLLTAVLTGFAVGFVRAGDRKALLRPLAYFALQFTSACLAAWDTALYTISLTMHFVEYHVIMMPRCFKTPLDETKRPDRILAFLRNKKIVFFGLLLLGAYGMQFASAVRAGTEFSAHDFLIRQFNGIFLFHYFVDAFIWKFSNPFYRKTLVPLYMEPGVKTTGSAKSP